MLKYVDKEILQMEKLFINLRKSILRKRIINKCLSGCGKISQI